MAPGLLEGGAFNLEKPMDLQRQLGIYPDDASREKAQRAIRAYLQIKLKALGLTISHSPGYEISPRGRAYLDATATD